MNDISCYNYNHYPIYLIVLYDLDANQIQFFQKIPIANFNWMKAQVSTHINYLLNVAKKQGKTLYNDLTDYNFTREIRVTSIKLNRSALLLFYNSTIDFYQIGPIVLNLRDCIQMLCETNKIEPSKLQKKYVDINTLLNDCLSLMNCYNRVLIKDLEMFSGRDAIYNEKCLIHLINKDTLRNIARDYSGGKDYTSIGIRKRNKVVSDEKRNNMICALKFKVNGSILRCNQESNEERFHRFNQKIVMPQYKISERDNRDINRSNSNSIGNGNGNTSASAIVLGTHSELKNEKEEHSAKNLKGKNNVNIKMMDMNDITAFERKYVSSSFISPTIHRSNNNIRNEPIVTESTLALVDLDFDTLKQKGKATSHSIISPCPTRNNPPQGTTALGNYPDISNINSRIEPEQQQKQQLQRQDHKKVNKSTFSRRNYNNNNPIGLNLSQSNKKASAEKKEIIDTIESSLDFNTIAKINQSVIQMSNKNQPQRDMGYKPKTNNLNSAYQRNNNNDNSNQLAQSTVPMFNLVQSTYNVNPNSSGNNSLWYDKKFQSQPMPSQTNKSMIMTSNSHSIAFNLNDNNPNVNSNTSTRNQRFSPKASSIFNDYNNNIQRFNSQRINNTAIEGYSNTLNIVDKTSSSTSTMPQQTMGNITNNISAAYINPHMTQNPNLKLNSFNSVSGSLAISPNVPTNRVNQKMQQDIPLSYSRFSSLPPDNNRYYSSSINTSTNLNIIPSTSIINSTSTNTNSNANFSEDDMSFLSFNNNQKKEYDDNIILSKTNPELMGDLREKYFYYFQKGTLIKSEGKGYIGLTLKNKFLIHKKLFSLMILQAKWKDQNYFSNKEFDNALLTKLTEVDYRLECKNLSSDLKIITYYPNPLKIENLVAIKVKNDYDQANRQVHFEINFSFNQQYISHVYRMVFNLLLRKTAQGRGSRIVKQSHQTVQIGEMEYKIELTNVVKAISFTIESFIANPIEKIQFCFEMKNCIPSQNEIRLNYNNSKLNQFTLNINKLAMIHYDYSL